MTTPLRADTRRVLDQLKQPNNPVANWDITKAKSLSKWRCVYVERIPDDQNEGNHCVYVDLISGDGLRINNDPFPVAFGWSGNNETHFVKLEKPAFEPAANFVLSAGMNAWCSVWTTDNSSDIVNRLYGEHGHTSYYVVFQYQNADSQPQPRPDGGSVTVNLADLRKWQKMARELSAGLEALE